MEMKYKKLSLLLFLLIAIFSCHSKHGKKTDPLNTASIKPKFEEKMENEAMQNDTDNSQTIELCVTEILTTSPRYIQLTKGMQEKVIKNGGSNYDVFLERSPLNIKQNNGNYSNTYDFTVYEMYDERKLNTARFSFNPYNKQLFEYDILIDSMVPIAFNTNLLNTYNSLKNNHR
jgi:predicted RND superfamily exporter protein